MTRPIQLMTCLSEPNPAITWGLPEYVWCLKDIFWQSIKESFVFCQWKINLHNFLPSGADRGHCVYEWRPQSGNPGFPKRTTKILHFTWNFLASVVWYRMLPRCSLQREIQHHVSTIFPNESSHSSCFKLLKQDVTARHSNHYSMTALTTFKYKMIFQFLLRKKNDK